MAQIVSQISVNSTNYKAQNAFADSDSLTEVCLSMPKYGVSIV